VGSFVREEAYWLGFGGLRKKKRGFALVGVQSGELGD
jgi:hypothetical protein